MAGIIVAFPKQEDAKSIRNLLVRNGYEVVSSCNTGAMAINLADSYGEGIIICGYRLPDMLYNEIVENVQGNFDVILVASKARLQDEVSDVAVLEIPLKVRELLNSVEMMQHNLLAKNQKGKHKPGQRTEEEKAIIEQAKAVLMEVNNLSESEAHRYIQKSAMDSGRTMVDTADAILTIMYKE